ncbi:hypothetical protein [Streptomyces arenae]|uniref:hypothetical protein n=1 Tax=Streptomyces arenae TaxID=29301 RepID=UPI00265816AF|nr:hypothetical protein [Streptomyces arenae]MCG7209609.1 hypothetical protein [Streptomyces arenae]
MRTARAILRHEARLMASLVRWAARRTSGTGTRFGYAEGQGAMMSGLAFVCVVETVAVSVLLRDWPAVERVMLVLDVYTVLMVVGLHAASVVHPHLLTQDALLVRNGVRLEQRIPLHLIKSVRSDTRYLHDRKAAAELDVPVGSQTSVTVELAEPVTHFTLLGRAREVSVVRLHADDATGLVRQLGQALTRARTAPSPCPDRPRPAVPAAARPAEDAPRPRSGL